MKLWLWWL